MDKNQHKKIKDELSYAMSGMLKDDMSTFNKKEIEAIAAFADAVHWNESGYEALKRLIALIGQSAVLSVISELVRDDITVLDERTPKHVVMMADEETINEALVDMRIMEQEEIMEARIKSKNADLEF